MQGKIISFPYVHYKGIFLYIEINSSQGKKGVCIDPDFNITIDEEIDKLLKEHLEGKKTLLKILKEVDVPDDLADLVKKYIETKEQLDNLEKEKSRYKKSIENLIYKSIF